jgi:hypothetical protein
MFALLLTLRGWCILGLMAVTDLVAANLPEVRRVVVWPGSGPTDRWKAHGDGTFVGRESAEQPGRFIAAQEVKQPTEDCIVAQKTREDDDVFDEAENDTS